MVDSILSEPEIFSLLHRENCSSGRERVEGVDTTVTVDMVDDLPVFASSTRWLGAPTPIQITPPPPILPPDKPLCTHADVCVGEMVEAYYGKCPVYPQGFYVAKVTRKFGKISFEVDSPDGTWKTRSVRKLTNASVRYGDFVE
jgi:hypothetical protein